MFTGIVEAKATVLQMHKHRLVLERPAFFTDVVHGSSIAVSGVCLSVAELDQDSLSFDVVPETLSRTNLGSLQTGQVVNLERALAANGRFEGHIVQGHVDGVGTVSVVERNAAGAVFTLDIPTELLRYIVEKGSITIDGVSLTVASIAKSHCTVALIPLTLDQTTLGSCQKGDRVNIETDILGKYVSALRT